MTIIRILIKNMVGISSPVDFDIGPVDFDKDECIPFRQKSTLNHTVRSRGE